MESIPGTVLVCALDPAQNHPCVLASMLVEPAQVDPARKIMGVFSPVVKEFAGGDEQSS